ncbi:Cytochrome c oxidase subunit 6A, mitochondrial [Lamellibrachia satsuma]|nr:Cytochrome c oxidase subunit 6A, mitochondrial [Lamellibrachia satsuma]
MELIDVLSDLLDKSSPAGCEVQFVFDNADVTIATAAGHGTFRAERPNPAPGGEYPLPPPQSQCATGRLWGNFAKRLPALRQFSSVAGPSATAGDHGAGMRLWKILSFTVAIPSVIVCYVNSQMKEKEEHERLKMEGVQPFVAYSHLRIRSKKWPWGDGNHSLFHNAHTNPLPDGYEESSGEH